MFFFVGGRGKLTVFDLLMFMAKGHVNRGVTLLVFGDARWMGLLGVTGLMRVGSIVYAGRA